MVICYITIDPVSGSVHVRPDLRVENVQKERKREKIGIQKSFGIHHYLGTSRNFVDLHYYTEKF